MAGGRAGGRAGAPGRPTDTRGRSDRAAFGRRAEDRACACLRAGGLHIVARNYRVGGGPGRPGGELDLVGREPDGTLVFVEVRARRGRGMGGAGGSIGATKRRRVLHAARVFLARFPLPPPCRFDVVLVQGDRLQWLKGAFDATGASDE